MTISTPFKIILLILVPLIIAVFIRFITWDSKEPSKAPEGKDKSGVDEKEEQSIKIISAWYLPDQLKEISGISWIAADRFACVQDETGSVFIYNIRTSSIETQIPFSGKGDYEGVAVVGKTIYVLQANGEIFEIINYESKDRQVRLHKTPLRKKSDSESLAYDKKNNRLLIAIKEGESGPGFKGIFSFDLQTKTMGSEPVYRIDLNNTIFDKDQSKNTAIQPSDIEIHPLTGEIYVIEGTKPKLMVMNAKGEILSLYKLKGKEFSQPEGLSFTPDGLMFISNEGDPGNILEVELNQAKGE